MTTSSELTADHNYLWDLPLLIYPERLELVSATHCETGEHWLEILDDAGADILGVVLPLEMKTASRPRQSLHGLELIEWLRYSADVTTGVNLCPVLAASWQPLQDVLKRRFEPLVISNGSYFTRLPEAIRNRNQRLRDFIQVVRGEEAAKYKAQREDLRRLSFGRAELAENLTHHDLANDYFAAWRLWSGYLRALGDVAQIRTKNTDARIAVKELLESAGGTQFEWLDELRRKIRRPYFRQFCLSRERIGVAPYPEVTSSVDVIRLHALNGLPSDTRILFVDDEFDKGMADVLLQILFGRPGVGTVEFTTAGPSGNEWVYSEPATRQTRDIRESDRWARMVCVKDISTAALWLKQWGEADLFNPKRKKAARIEPKRSESEWTDDWANFWDPREGQVREITDILGYQASGRANLDKDIARPKTVTTFIFLDLRLKTDAQQGDDASLESDSKQFLTAIKDQRPDVPVMMFTASRQTNKYTEFMVTNNEQKEPVRADGWLIKEAPDAFTDDSNSSRAAYYLLDFVYLSAQMNNWYRPSIGWDQDVKKAYHEMWSSPYFTDCLESISHRADTYIKNLQDPQFRERNRGRKLLGSVQQDGENFKFDIEDRLVTRRIAVWALMYTADWSGDYPMWNVAEFLDHLSCMPVDISIKYPSNVLNFKTDLYLDTYTHKLLERLLKEEYQWLEVQNWPEQAKDTIIRYLNLIKEKENI